MAIATSLVALALLGTDPAPALAPAPAMVPDAALVALENGDQISCQMQMTTVDGLGWRSAAYSRLNSVGQKGACMIWTADRSLKRFMEESGDGKFQSAKAPKVTSFRDATAKVTQRGPFQYIGDGERVADGPINQATQVAFCPKVATIEVGFTSEHSARRLDQGVLAKVKVAETHVGTVHRIALSEYIHPAQEDASTALTEVGRKLFQTFIKGDATSISVPVMVPEVASAEVEGEWLVPNDSILIVSLGIDTTINPDGKPVTHERLAIYDFARPSDEARTAQANTATTKPFQEVVTYEIAPAGQTGAAAGDHVPNAVAIATANPSLLNMPPVPARSFPEATDADGQVFDLPPLPEAYASADLDRIKPGSPLATPQSSPITRPERTMADPQLARTSFELEPVPEREIENYTYNVETPVAPPEAPASTPAPGLASVVESFLRGGIEGRGMKSLGMLASLPDQVESDACPNSSPNALSMNIGTSSDDHATCSAPGCPFAAEGCDARNQPKTLPAAKVEMGVSVRDGKGLCVYNAEEDLVAALKTPGKTEVKYIPLGDNLSLEIQAKVIANPERRSIETNSPSLFLYNLKSTPATAAQAEVKTNR